MSNHVKKTVCNVIPGLRYHDAPAAIEWLCTAFGFEKMLIVPHGDKIAHAQLRFGTGMVMLGSTTAGGGAYEQVVRPPTEVGGVNTAGAYVIVDDIDVHYARAVAHGAEVVLENKDQDYGGRGYTCRDPEGHVWSFGTYDPWGDAG